MLALLETLQNTYPFSLLDTSALQRIEDTSQIAYYPEETSLITENELPGAVYFIIKGIVEVYDADGLIDIYQSHDFFAALELVKQQPSTANYMVKEELICYEIPAEIFLLLTKENKAFKTSFFSSMVERMERLKEKTEATHSAEMMLARVDAEIVHSPCIVSSSMSIIAALQKLEASSKAALIVENEEGYGIVTDADLRYYILHKEEKNLEIISQLQSYPIAHIEEGTLVFNALLRMSEQNIKHLAVMDENERLLGLLELSDLLSYLSNQTHIVSVQMQRAQTLEALIQAAQRIEVMVGILHNKGVKNRYIAKVVSDIHKKMYAKLFHFIFPTSWHDHCTLLLLGSEGRGEQILRTDQDNAIIFEEGFNPENKDQVLHTFIETLDKIGFPRCKGNVMVINPKWSRSLEGYKKEIRDWTSTPNYDSLIDMAIFYDTYAVAGNLRLFKTLRSYLFERVTAHKEYLRYFAKSIHSFESPLGLFSRFVTEDKTHKDEIDIKKGALFALIHGVRALSLEYGIAKTNTNERIKALNDLGYMAKEEAHDLLETLEVLNTLRLQAQLEKIQAKKPLDNYIRLTTLGKLERDTLKEALKIVDVFKKRVAYHFKLEMLG